MESADRESRRLDILSVKKEANLSAREVGEVEVGRDISETSLSSQSLGYGTDKTNLQQPR